MPSASAHASGAAKRLDAPARVRIIRRERDRGPEFMPDRDQLLQPSDPTLLYSAFSVNDHYPDRPRSIAALYAEVIGYCELAERLGFDSYFVAEHHFHEYGVVPNPAVMLAALAPRTTRIRLGSAISILTFHNRLTVA